MQVLQQQNESTKKKKYLQMALDLKAVICHSTILFSCLVQCLVDKVKITAESILYNEQIPQNWLLLLLKCHLLSLPFQARSLLHSAILNFELLAFCNLEWISQYCFKSIDHKGSQTLTCKRSGGPIDHRKCPRYFFCHAKVPEYQCTDEVTNQF